MTEEDTEYGIDIGATLRENGINTEVFLEDKKLKAKFKYADKLNIPYVLVLRRRRKETQKSNLKEYGNRRARNARA